MPTDVIVTQNGPVAHVRFEAPNEIHILSADTRRLLSEAIDKLDHTEDCRIVIFEARGRTFLAGADLTELQGLHQDSAIWFAEAGQKLMNQIAGMRAVTICAVQAPCAGGGCELALACDFRLAAAGSRIGLPEVSLGLIPGWGGTVRATSLLGGAVARRIILTGELLPAEEALRIGLVDQVFADAEFQQGVDKFVAQLISRAPQAAKRAKRLISQLTRSGLKKALGREARQFAACYASLEPLEGIAAFREKRTPEWANARQIEPATDGSPEVKPKRQKNQATSEHLDVDQSVPVKRKPKNKPE
jgi:enoyl-CoA hydratase